MFAVVDQIIYTRIALQFADLMPLYSTKQNCYGVVNASEIKLRIAFVCMNVSAGYNQRSGDLTIRLPPAKTGKPSYNCLAKQKGNNKVFK